MKVIEVEQGTPEWRTSRLAMVTGTRMDSVMGSNLDKLMLICELIAEEGTEQAKSYKATQEMDRGTTEEAFAKKYFSEKSGKKITDLGFCISDELPYLGVSGDGWIKTGKTYGEAVEVKSPDSKTAVFYTLADLLNPEELGLGTWSKPTKTNPEEVFTPSAKAPFCGIPAQYKWQVITYFLVNTDLKKLHFIIWDPRFINDDNKMYVVTVERSNPLIAAAIEEAKTELKEFREVWLTLRSKIIKDNF